MTGLESDSGLLYYYVPGSTPEDTEQVRGAGESI